MLRTAHLVPVLGMLSGLLAERTAPAQPATPPPAAAQAAPAEPAFELSLGSYERRALAVALQRRALKLEPAPAGKRVRFIHVVNLDVFGEEEGFLTWFNVFHRTSREHVVEREVLLRPGMAWDAELVDESQRRLRDPLFTAMAVIAPVVATGGGPDEVDVLVVSRDIWSLRLNSRWEFQETTLSDLSVSISENNLLGYRKQVALVFDMDLGAFSLGPQYVDKNIAGTHLQLLAKVDALFTRDLGPGLFNDLGGFQDFEGTRSYVNFGYPLWSLRTPWAAGVEASHFDGVRRAFGPGPVIATYEYVDPVTGDVQAIPYMYDDRVVNIESTVTRQLGDSVKHRISLGHDLDVQRPEVRDDFPGDDAARAAFEADVLPRSERASALFVRYTGFTPIYRVYRNMDSFDLSEDQRLGPDLVAEVGAAMKPIGSETNFQTGSIAAGWNFEIAGDALLRLSVSGAGRRQDGEVIDKLATATVTGISPVVLIGRLAARVTWSRRYDETNNRYFSLGGDTGLRGYAIGEFRTIGANPVRVLTNVELRTLPIRVLFARAGAILFWDMGHAANCYEGCDDRLTMYHDVGVGLRGLVPQLQPYVFRVDWAIPLNGENAGFPGRFVAGVQQIF